MCNKNKIKKITSAAIALASVGAMTNIICSAEYTSGQVQPPSDFFLFEDDTGGYICFKNQYGTYTIGQGTEQYLIYPQVDWFSDGKWHYTDVWDDANQYNDMYNLESNKISDYAGNIKIYDNINSVTTFYDENSLPEKLRIRYITMYSDPISESGFSTEIGEWSEEIDLNTIHKISLNDYEMDAPIICSCEKTENGYELKIHGGENFLKTYSFPQYKLVMYIEGKSNDVDWSNLMSVLPMGESESYLIEISEDSSLYGQTGLSFRCKYGIVYNGETKYSEWSNTAGEGTAVDDAEFVSNGDAIFVPNTEKSSTQEPKMIDDFDDIPDNQETSINIQPLPVMIGIITIIVAVVIGINILRKKSKGRK